MDFYKIKKVHIIGIGGCASSGIAEFLQKKGITVTGSEMKKREDLLYLENMGININYQHSASNITKDIDLVLYSPAIIALNPDNPELVEAKRLNIKELTWEEFIGEYLDSQGSIGITVSGSEGKGTTAGALTTILKETYYDPLSILGAKIKNIHNNKDSNIYIGKGKSYILEADEYNRNFFHYHPSINIMLNFQYEHPETYKDFNEYKKAFFTFFSNMSGERKLILRATNSIKEFVKEYDIEKNHTIIWFGTKEEINDITSSSIWEIDNKKINENGIEFLLRSKDKSYNFFVPAFPGYMIYNTTGAIIAAFTLGLPYEVIKKNIKNFTGMVRRFDCHKTKGNGYIITDYGHSPESIKSIIKEVHEIFKNKRLHLVFQPHLYSRTFAFFDEFVKELSNADIVSLIDIYPAREKKEDWHDKISSVMLYERLKKLNKEVYYLGESKNIYENIKDKIDKNNITCFIGAGDMDHYYSKIIDEFT